MSRNYSEYKTLHLPAIADDILWEWEEKKTFQKSVDRREGRPSFVFTEGPPSANGQPGIHHVMARTIKDIFCRYKTLKGFQVKRKAGWDTHGLPVELNVEKTLGITKEAIGTRISVEDYNTACREAVMRYTDMWNDLTRKMGYWVDVEQPYMTYDTKYIESVWWALSQLYEKGFMYKGHSVQPYSPKAGTGLSSHELNQPGCYKEVKDTSCVAQFRVESEENIPFKNVGDAPLYLLAWTTTPWTLPSNTALTVGPNIDYVLIQTWNQYTHLPIQVVLAKKLVDKQFGKKYTRVTDPSSLRYVKGDKEIPYAVVDSCRGAELCGIRYEQLLNYSLPYKDADKAFVVIPGDFVTTEDGTGIVHTAPTFGADDAAAAQAAGVPPLLVLDENGQAVPLVDLQGRFRKEVSDPVFGLAGEYVKAAYLEAGEAETELVRQRERLRDIIAELDHYLSVDERIALKLKMTNRAFRIEKYSHSYPHCWRTDKPVLYYPLDAWFIKVTEKRERLVELNQAIHWKPEATGKGRFGNWLATANDWNLSRSRYWGIPLPVWVSQDGTERLCIGSIEQLKQEIQTSIDAGFMQQDPLADFKVGDYSLDNYAAIDLHKNEVDAIVLVSPSGAPMKRETEVIDVWFDSGAAPFAQHHYPFEHKTQIERGIRAFQSKVPPEEPVAFPSDYIAEGVDQTRGWFYTQHLIATLLFDTVAYKHVISNGLVLDKEGRKMSKRLGNAVDPFHILSTYGADPSRWYLITNAQPWENLKFDTKGIVEVQRKYFGTLHNTYAFFALYANIDHFHYAEEDCRDRPEMDCWIISRMHSLIRSVQTEMDNYEPSKAARSIQHFVTDELSNWYVRLCRRRFWKGDYSADKISAYQTLYQCMETVALLSAPFAPFYMDRLFNDLNAVSQRSTVESVHLADFPKADPALIDPELEQKMTLAQKVASMVLSLRKQEQIKVRQPLQKIMIPVPDDTTAERLKAVEHVILAEVNVKSMELFSATDHTIIRKKITPNFKTIGPKYGKQMKAIAQMVREWAADDIAAVEVHNGWRGTIEGTAIDLARDDFEIVTDDVPGWIVASEGKLTVALDITLNDALKSEGIARELINRTQLLRKERGLEVTDTISLKLNAEEAIRAVVQTHQDYIKTEVLAEEIVFSTAKENGGISVDLEVGNVYIHLTNLSDS